MSKLPFPSPHKTTHTHTSPPHGPSPSSNIKLYKHKRTHTHPSAPHLHISPKLSLQRSSTSLYTSFLILSDPLSPPLSKPLQCISPNPPQNLLTTPITQTINHSHRHPSEYTPHRNSEYNFHKQLQHNISHYKLCTLTCPNHTPTYPPPPNHNTSKLLLTTNPHPRSPSTYTTNTNTLNLRDYHHNDPSAPYATNPTIPLATPSVQTTSMHFAQPPSKFTHHPNHPNN